jgi:MerR family transcriptional regulator, heat shock protein HspR
VVIEPMAVIPREQAAENLSVSLTVLRRYEARGLIRASVAGEVEGYEPPEIRRLWTIVSLQRDLGVNLAGVEAVLRLRDHVDDMHRLLRDLAEGLRAALEEQALGDDGRPKPIA